MNEALRNPAAPRWWALAGAAVLCAASAGAVAPAATPVGTGTEVGAGATSAGSPTSPATPTTGAPTVPPGLPGAPAPEAPGAGEAEASPVAPARPSLPPQRAEPEWVSAGLDADEGPGESAAGILVRTVLVLGVVLAAIYLTLNVGLRRLMGLGVSGPRGARSLVAVVERHAVGPRQALLVVRAGTDYLVVGQSETGMSLLSRLEPAQVEAQALAAAAASAQAPSLSPFLQKLLARKTDSGQAPPPPTPSA